MLSRNETTGAITAYAGTHAPGECSHCDDPGPICCTFATYDDGSADEPVCKKCCTCRPSHRLDRDRIYSPD
jgi:hypothetical protein